MVSARSAGASTVVSTLALLFSGLGSGWSPATLAGLVIVPAAPGCTTIVITALPPFARAPTLQVTVVVPEHEPWLGVAETKRRRPGACPSRTTPVVGFGPLLVTVRV